MKKYVALIKGIQEGCKHTIGCNLNWRTGDYESAKDFYEEILGDYESEDDLIIEIHEISGESFKFGMIEEDSYTWGDNDVAVEMIEAPMKKCLTIAGNALSAPLDKKNDRIKFLEK